MQTKVSPLLLSTDTLPNYGLDLIFFIAKKSGFDGIDLAMRKGFDARDEEYVQSLSLKHDLPVYIIQTSPKLNQKEMDKALDLCQATNANIICLNAPKITDFKAYDFIVDNLKKYKESNPDIHFTILNPKDSRLFALPIPEYRFSNIIDIVKKYDSFVGLDISNVNIDSFENEFARKIDDYVPYLSVIYLSDKSKDGKHHLIPGEGNLDLKTFLTRLRKSGYSRPISVKLDLKPTELANRGKLKTLLKKAKDYYDQYFVNVEETEED